MRKVMEYHKDDSKEIFAKLMYDSGRLWFTFKKTDGSSSELIRCVSKEEAEIEKQKFMRGELSHI